MFAIEIEYLLGRAASSCHDDRMRAEWPPHPARLFAALVAVYGDIGGDEEREALQWLERQPPPSLAVADGDQFVGRRETSSVFVPVNDSTAPSTVPARGFSANQLKTGIEVLPGRRPRKERFFPAVIPEPPVVHFIWEDADDEFRDHHDALQHLASHLTYLGHSSSLVRAAIVDNPPSPTLKPADQSTDGEHILRVPSRGRFDRLVHVYELSQQLNRRIEPPLGRSLPYVRTQAEQPTTPQSVFGRAGDWIVFRRRTGMPMPLHASLRVTHRFREAVQSVADHQLPESFTGHASDGRPSQNPHAAIVPLPFVDHRYADGNIMGVAVVLPRHLSLADRRNILRALANIERLQVSRSIEWQLERLPAESRLKSLQPSRYWGPARYWATVTPIVFGHFPKDFDGRHAVRIVGDSCELSGLPRPHRVRIRGVSPILGVPPAPHFPTLSVRGKPILTRFNNRPEKSGKTDAQGNPARYRAHVEIDFGEQVAGPVIIGSGRYLGMGLCLPRFHWSSIEVD